MNTRLLEALSKLGEPRVLVLGDLILDRYVWGTVSRVSPEAPVQILKVDREDYRPGGASNRTLLATTNLSSIQQPLTDPLVGTLMLALLRRYEFSMRRFGSGPKPASGAVMPTFMPWMSALRMMIPFEE